MCVSPTSYSTAIPYPDELTTFSKNISGACAIVLVVPSKRDAAFRESFPHKAHEPNSQVVEFIKPLESLEW